MLEGDALHFCLRARGTEDQTGGEAKTVAGKVAVNRSALGFCPFGARIFRSNSAVRAACTVPDSCSNLRGAQMFQDWWLFTCCFESLPGARPARLIDPGTDLTLDRMNIW